MLVLNLSEGLEMISRKHSKNQKHLRIADYGPVVLVFACMIGVERPRLKCSCFSWGLGVFECQAPRYPWINVCVLVFRRNGMLRVRSVSSPSALSIPRLEQMDL